MTHQDYIALVNQANRASYEYYVLSRPSMSDADFDKLIMYLEGCEYEHPEWIVPDSPTQQVGSDLSANGRRTIAHRTPMLSCQKAQEKDAVIYWLNKTVKSIGHNRFSISAEWKYDGISCSLVYLDGQLISASTRGDGHHNCPAYRHQDASRFEAKLSAPLPTLINWIAATPTAARLPVPCAICLNLLPTVRSCASCLGPWMLLATARTILTTRP